VNLGAAFRKTDRSRGQAFGKSNSRDPKVISESLPFGFCRSGQIDGDLFSQRATSKKRSGSDEVQFRRRRNPEVIAHLPTIMFETIGRTRTIPRFSSIFDFCNR
jgi:hypothetical protein